MGPRDTLERAIRAAHSIGMNGFDRFAEDVVRRWRNGLMPVSFCIAVCISAAGSAAPPASDPDWPCMLIRVPHLSLTAVWSGPSVDGYLGSWSADPAIADLARRVAERRMPEDEAGRAIYAFADAAGEQRRDRVLALMAGIFTTLTDERDTVMAGLDRYGRRQKELADGVRADLEKLRTAQAAPDQEPGAVAALQQKVEWETRLFEQRRELLHYACDVPTRIEHRLFVLARIVQPLLD